MWIFTTKAFISAVQKRPSDNFLTIRARVRADLDHLREEFMPELSKTIDHAGTDYPYRATIGKEAFAEGMKKLALSIDYSNFKSETERVSGLAREQVYAQVWTVHNNMEEKIKRRESEIRMHEEMRKRQKKMF